MELLSFYKRFKKRICFDFLTCSAFISKFSKTFFLSSCQQRPRLMSILNALFLKISEAYGQDHKDRPSEKINIIPVVIIMRANLRALLTVKETINNHFFINFG